ncbi:MAG: hypothetical protein E7171_00150 [Firmicutes bacterium]|nr:hypothetical protein [Bacillota bacterium]
MAGNYFIEYTNYINDLQYKLMKIQLRYNECIENVRRALRDGEITEEEANVLFNQRMDMYYEQYDSKYTLSKRDVEFVRTYAALDRNGMLLASFLKSEYLDKKDKLLDILEAVKIYGYLDSLSSEDARLTVKSAMFEHYNSQLEKIENRMNNLISMYGEKEKRSRRYLELDEQRNKLLKALNAIAGLDKASEEVFDRIVRQFYDVDKKYYEWFLKMQIKQEYEDGTVYQEHVDTMTTISDTTTTLVNSSDEVISLNRTLEDTNREMFNVILGISQYDVDSALALQEKPKKRMFRKEELNNKEGLFNVFVGLLTINGLKSYIEFMYGNGNDTINLNETFEVYFTKKYGEGTMYVDPNKFINDFRDDVIAYYKEKIEEIINKINVLNVKINSNTYLMCGNIKVGMNQAVLQRDIREQYPAKRDELMIVGFTMDELNRIYTDLKEFVGNGFSFGTDDEELFLRKV